MKIKLAGKNLDDIRPLLAAAGLEESAGDFELVLTYGGDGALLGAEYEYPGVPKLPLRDAATAPTCPRHQAEMILAAFAAGKLPATELPLLTAAAPDGSLRAMNDIFLHNLDRSAALRYRVFIDGKLYASEAAGDGVCFSSVHGSTAYYRSITRGVFRVGVGVAFSNATMEVDHLVLPEDAEVRIQIIRGPGLLIADNNPCQIPVAAGEEVVFRQSGERTMVYGLETFMCPDCRVLRHLHP